MDCNTIYRGYEVCITASGRHRIIKDGTCIDTVRTEQQAYDLIDKIKPEAYASMVGKSKD